MTRSPHYATLLLAGFLVVLLPAPANAAGAGIWEYLERLSGPGPFEGRSVKVPVVCEFAEMEDGEPTGDARKVWFLRCINPRLLPGRMPVTPRAGGTWWKRRGALAVYVGRLTTNQNELAYVREPDDRGIVWWKFGPTFIWYAKRSLDLHTSVEWNRLSSKGTAFEPFWVNSLELVGATWKPGVSHGAPFKWLSLGAGVKVLTRSIKAEEFGAIPGAGPDGWRESGRELQLQLSVGLNIWDF